MRSRYNEAALGGHAMNSDVRYVRRHMDELIQRKSSDLEVGEWLHRHCPTLTSPKLTRVLFRSTDMTLSVFALFVISMKWSLVPGVGALLGASALGWYRIIRRRLAARHTRSEEDTTGYGWDALVQAVPPVVFGETAFLWMEAGHLTGGVLFAAAALLTAPPPIWMIMKVCWRKLRRRKSEREVTDGAEHDKMLGSI